MTSSSETDPPECPVCLQTYDTFDTIPRVLACGHSTCERCLSQLPPSFPSSSSTLIRCPSCTQLVKLPHPQGPSALPKNIDLLRFCLNLAQPHKEKATQTLVDFPPRRHFPTQIWSENVYSAWKYWVLPQSVILIEGECEGEGGSGLISLSCDLGLCPFVGFRLFEGQKVRLVEIGQYEGKESVVEYGYMGKVMSVLSCMSDALRNELELLLKVSLRNDRVCNVLGLWLDVNSARLYIVSERKSAGGFNLIDLKCEDGEEDSDLVRSLLDVGVQLCETLIGLGSEGFVCGCLSLSCLDIDEFGLVYVDLVKVLVAGRKFRECVVKGMNSGCEMDGFEAEELLKNMSNIDVFVSPEMVFEFLRKEGFELQINEMNITLGCSSDVWLLACVLLRLVIGKHFAEGMYNYLRGIFERKCSASSDREALYLNWIDTVNATMSETFVDSCYSSLQEILLNCLIIDQGSRAPMRDVWRSIRRLTGHNLIARISSGYMRERVCQCLFLGELCDISNDSKKKSRVSELNKEHDIRADPILAGEVRVDDVVQELCVGKMRCKDLQGHLDCITGLCVGGGFLFSSSLDKTVKVWSLQDLTLVHTFRGHEHRVMAMVFVDQEKPLCISADGGGGIFAWEVKVPFGQEPLNKWYEEKDWRYSGIHALAISEFNYLYTGSGDRLIKAWSLRDHTLVCSMEGHKSVVSSLAICNGVLYSGSWDGTVRLWSLHDHSSLAVFGEGTPGVISSVLSLHADQSMVIAAHENGHIKIWMNDELRASRKIHNGAILALAMEEDWVFTGGWDKAVNFQEIKSEGFEMDVREVGSIACESVITALLYVGGILFVGFANRLIKVYQCE